MAIYPRHPHRTKHPKERSDRGILNPITPHYQKHVPKTARGFGGWWVGAALGAVIWIVAAVILFALAQ